MRLTSTATYNIMQAMRDSGRAGMHIAIDLLAYEELGTGDCWRTDDSLKKDRCRPRRERQRRLRAC